jgi:NADP-reducing hydrogenase subunit HndB
MKSLAELEAIRKATISKINLRNEDKDGATRVVVGMATCGIAAGARPVMLSFVEQVEKKNLQHVTVSQTGCVGMCRLEPMVDVYVPGHEKVTYVHVKPDMVERIVTEHIQGGHPVTEYTIGAAENN